MIRLKATLNDGTVGFVEVHDINELIQGGLHMGVRIIDFEDNRNQIVSQKNNVVFEELKNDKDGEEKEMSQQLKIGVANICTAFKYTTIGSKVTDVNGFIEVLVPAIQNHDTSKDRAPGQHFIVLPGGREYVSAGDGLKSDNPDDYIVRTHREGPKMFLKREKAGETKFLAVVVYTREAYIADPDLTADDLATLDPWATHFIVAVIASSGPSAPVTPGRFVANLAGGNNEYRRPVMPQRTDDIIDGLMGHIDWLENKAKEIKEYWNKYSVVAD